VQQVKKVVEKEYPNKGQINIIKSSSGAMDYQRQVLLCR